MKRTIFRCMGILALSMPLLIAVRPAAAQPVGGPISRIDRVLARSADVYRVVCYGSEPIRIIVAGDGDTDLDLYVYDSRGNLVAYDNDLTDFCVVRFTPAYTDVFTIRIVNLGSVYNEYRLTVE